MSEYQHIVRILGNDIPGEKKTLPGLTQIRGVGYNFANAILTRLGIEPSSSMGYMDEETAKKIEDIIKDPREAGFPVWFLNRRKDMETGEDKHLLTSDIQFTIRNDIERERQTSSLAGAPTFVWTEGARTAHQDHRPQGRNGGCGQGRKGPAGEVMG